MTAGPCVVFTGPSLSHSQARSILPDAVFLPPAAMGDVVSAVRRFQPHALALIDGSFMGTMSVFHKELLYAMDSGCWVLGGASMGALRAAECDRFGMLGVGVIYEALRSGQLQDDDEVALSHADAEHDFAPLSDAMVTIRAACDQAAGAGIITIAQAEALSSMQKARWFPDRHLASTIVDAKALDIDPVRVQELDDFIRNRALDPKREDAIAVLEATRGLPSERPQHRPGTYLSGVFRAVLARDVFVAANQSTIVSFDQIRRYAALNDPGYEGLMREGRRRLAMSALSIHLAGLPSDEELAQARAAIARSFGVTVETLEAHAQTLDLDAIALDELIEQEALIMRLEHSALAHRHHGSATLEFMNAARLSGRYGAMKDATALQHRAAQTVMFAESVPFMQLAVTQAAISDWQLPPDLEAYVSDNNLGSTAELRVSLEASVKAHQALFGTGLVQYRGEDIELFDHVEPMMARGE